jgi:peptide/nickel transport system substrate-binding protein
MKTSHPNRRPLLVAALFAGVLVAVHSACPRPSPLRPDDTLVMGVLADIQSWNPYLTETRFSEDLLALVYPSLAVELADYQEHPPTFRPSLAESWSRSEDGLAIEFVLRNDVVWSDGTPVTADDVVFTFEIQKSPEVAWYASYVKDFIESVEKVDDHIVRFVFNQRYPYQLMDANEGLIIPAHAWRDIPPAEWSSTSWLDRVVGAGPYLPSAHTPQQEIVMVANESYGLGPRAAVDTIVWRIVPDQLSLTGQTLNGQFDFVYAVPPEDAEKIAAQPDLRLVSYADRGYTHICWNTTRPGLDNPEVRRALTMAIDRQAIIDIVFLGFAEPSLGPILSGMWAFDPEIERVPFDPDAAAALLADQGWTDSDGDGIVDRAGEPFSIELLTNSENRMRQDISVLVAGYLQKIGVAVTPRTVEWGTLLARLDAGEFDGSVNRWVEPTQIDLEDVWHTPPEGVPTSNYGRYSNAEVDRLIAEVAANPPLEVQRRIYRRIQALIVADQPYTFLAEGQRLNALHSRVANAVLNDTTPYFNLEQWELLTQ